MYRKPASAFRKISYSDNSVSENEPPLIITKEYENIPLPNEAEISPAPMFEDESLRNLKPFNIFGKDFFIDDIILVGVIFLLLQDQVNDEFLILILLYLFLF